MDTYYEEILNEIAQLIEKKDVQKAYSILHEELSMPYIPKEYEEPMVTYYNQCRSELTLQQGQKNYQEEDVEKLLQGSVAEQFVAVDILKKHNIRKYIEVIEGYLMKSPHPFVRSLLIEALMEQGITDEMKLLYEDIEVVFVPCYIEKPMECEGANKAVQCLRDWFEHENPTFLMMCVESLIKELYLRLPFNVEEDEGELLALSIAKYVFHAGDDLVGWNAFIVEKALAQNSSFELLLNKHDVFM